MHSRSQRERSEDLTTFRWWIYTLSDPREPGVVRYVGFTTNVKLRRRSHLNDAKKGHTRTRCGLWKQKLAKEGVLPVMAIVQEGEGKDQWATAEQDWIEHYRDIFGSLLTNMTNGGEGHFGYIASEETRKKLAENARHRDHSNRAKPNLTDEDRQKMRERMMKLHSNPDIEAYRRERHRAATVGIPRSEEAKAKSSATTKGVPMSEERRQRLIGQKRSEEARRNMSAAHKGKPLSKEHVAAAAAAHVGLKRTEESKEKTRQAILAWHAKRREEKATAAQEEKCEGEA